MSCLSWAPPCAAAIALGLLRLVSREHAREALATVSAIAGAATILALPLILARS